MTASQSQSQTKLILLREENKQLRIKYQLLLTQHQQTLEQLAQMKQAYQNQKQINHLLSQNLKKQKMNMSFSQNNITLNIQGQFLNKRIFQLQEQLSKYKNGVNQSVDRRVKKIVEEINNDKDLEVQKRIEFEKRKSRLTNNLNKSNITVNLADSQDEEKENHIYQENHNHYYNIQYHNNQNGNTNQQSLHNKEYSVSVIPQKNNHNQYNPQNSTFLKKKSSLNQTPTQKNLSKPNKKNQEQQDIRQSNFGGSEILTPYTIKISNVSEKTGNGFTESQFHCLNCSVLEKQLAQRNYQIYNLKSQIQEYKKQYQNLLNLYQNLRQQHDLVLDELNRKNSNFDHNETHYVNRPSFQKRNQPQNQFFQNSQQNIEIIEHHQIFQDNQNHSNPKRQQKMLRQISNLMNDISKNRKIKEDKDKKSRISFTNNNQSRISMHNKNGNSHLSAIKLDNSVFTIKQGVNRYGNRNDLF